MAKGNLQRCLEQVRPFEGGCVDHPRDPGGATNMSITIAVLKQWRGKAITKQDVRNLSKAEAAEIYAKRYWNPLRGDDLRIAAMEASALSWVSTKPQLEKDAAANGACIYKNTAANVTLGTQINTSGEPTRLC